MNISSSDLNREEEAKPAGVAADGSGGYALTGESGWSGIGDEPGISNGGIRQTCGIEACSGSVVTNEHFENFILTLIVVNAIMMGVATTDAVTENPSVARAFDMVDLVFLIIFTVELVLDFGYRGLGLFRSGWLTFDFLVIVLSWVFPSLQVVRGFRLLRLLARSRDVQKITRALQSVLPMLASIVVLLAVIFYVSAVMFTDLFGSMYQDGLTSEDYFSDLGKTLFTLFQVMTGAGWPDIAREIMETYCWAWIPFVCFLSVTMFVVIELTIAALCKSISKLEEMDRKADEAGQSQTRLGRLEEHLDRLTRETGSRDRHGKRVSAPATMVTVSAPPVLSGRHEQWYDLVSLSFDEDEQLHPADDSDFVPPLNCFPRAVQSMCGSIVTNRVFQNTIIILIVLNSITMGLATYSFVSDNDPVRITFDLLDLAFLLVFTVELVLQVGYRGLSFFKSGWLIFDLVVISVSWVFPTLQVARAFRCFRIFSKVRFMREILSALFSIAPKLAIIAGLLLLMFYIFSVMFTEFFKHMYKDGLTSEDYFGSLAKTMFTLFQCMTIAGWPDVAREVMATYDWAWFPFVAWIIVSKFTMIQLIIAVLCQSLAHVPSDEDEEDANDEIARLEKKVELLSSNIMGKTQAEPKLEPGSKGNSQEEQNAA